MSDSAGTWASQADLHERKRLTLERLAKVNRAIERWADPQASSDDAPSLRVETLKSLRAMLQDVLGEIEAQIVAAPQDRRN